MGAVAGLERLVEPASFGLAPVQIHQQGDVQIVVMLTVGEKLDPHSRIKQVRPDWLNQIYGLCYGCERLFEMAKIPQNLRPAKPDGRFRQRLGKSLEKLVRMIEEVQALLIPAAQILNVGKICQDESFPPDISSFSGENTSFLQFFPGSIEVSLVPVHDRKSAPDSPFILSLLSHAQGLLISPFGTLQIVDILKSEPDAVKDFQADILAVLQLEETQGLSIETESLLRRAYCQQEQAQIAEGERFLCWFASPRPELQRCPILGKCSLKSALESGNGSEPIVRQGLRTKIAFGYRLLQSPIQEESRLAGVLEQDLLLSGFDQPSGFGAANEGSGRRSFGGALTR
jgi:hypothetical protein